LMIGILTGMMWNLNATFIFIHFMAKDVQHFFIIYQPLVFLFCENCSIYLPFIRWIVSSLWG
jgi:hypothetical protein